MISSALKTPSWSSIRYRVWSERCVWVPADHCTLPKNETKMPLENLENVAFLIFFAPKKLGSPKSSSQNYPFSCETCFRFRGEFENFQKWPGIQGSSWWNKSHQQVSVPCRSNNPGGWDGSRIAPPLLQKNTGVLHQRSCKSKTIHVSQRLLKS